MDMGADMGGDDAALLGDETVFSKGGDQQAKHRDSVVSTDAEVAGLFTAGSVEDGTVQLDLIFLQIAPFLPSQPPAVQAIKECFFIAHKDVVEGLFPFAGEVIGGECGHGHAGGREGLHRLDGNEIDLRKLLFG